MKSSLTFTQLLPYIYMNFHFYRVLLKVPDRGLYRIRYISYIIHIVNELQSHCILI